MNTNPSGIDPYDIFDQAYEAEAIRARHRPDTESADVERLCIDFAIGSPASYDNDPTDD